MRVMLNPFRRRGRRFLLSPFVEALAILRRRRAPAQAVQPAPVQPAPVPAEQIPVAPVAEAPTPAPIPTPIPATAPAAPQEAQVPPEGVAPPPRPRRRRWLRGLAGGLAALGTGRVLR